MITNLKCSNCGAPLEVEEIDKKIVICPFCNCKNAINEYINKDVCDSENEIFYYPVNRLKSEFEAQCTQLLKNDDMLPNDIFKEINFQKIQCIYIPVWVFEGKYEFRYNYKNDKGDSVFVNADRQFCQLFCAYKGDELSQKIVEEMFALECRFEVLPEVISTNKIEREGHVVIHPNLKISISQQAFIVKLKGEAFYQAKKEHQSFSLIAWNMYLNDIKEPENAMIYVPYYIAEFNYKNDSYYIMADAFSGETMKWRLPEDEERKKLLKKDFDSSFNIIGIIIMLVPIALWILGIIGFWKALLYFLICSVVGSLVMTIGITKSEKKKKEIIENAKKERNKAIE